MTTHAQSPRWWLVALAAVGAACAGDPTAPVDPDGPVAHRVRVSGVSTDAATLLLRVRGAADSVTASTAEVFPAGEDADGRRVVLAGRLREGVELTVWARRGAPPPAVVAEQVVSGEDLTDMGVGAVTITPIGAGGTTPR